MFRCRAVTADPPLPRRSGGFTLLEVMVALIIASLALGAVMSLFQTSLRQTRAADELRLLTQLAEAELARFGTELPLEAGERDGVSAEGFRWQARVSRVETDGEDRDVALYRIDIEASVEDGAGSVSLTTLRIGAL